MAPVSAILATVTCAAQSTILTGKLPQVIFLTFVFVKRVVASRFTKHFWELGRDGNSLLKKQIEFLLYSEAQSKFTKLLLGLDLCAASEAITLLKLNGAMGTQNASALGSQGSPSTFRSTQAKR